MGLVYSRGLREPNWDLTLKFFFLIFKNNLTSKIVGVGSFCLVVCQA